MKSPNSGCNKQTEIEKLVNEYGIDPASVTRLKTVSSYTKQVDYIEYNSYSNTPVRSSHALLDYPTGIDPCIHHDDPCQSLTGHLGICLVKGSYREELKSLWMTIWIVGLNIIY